MAKLQGEVVFTGTLGDLSAYRMRGVDRIIVRRKGGPSKKKIKSHPNFDLVRRNNSEFGGRATAAKWIMRGLHIVKRLGDYNISGPLNALMKPVQRLSHGTLGQRDVLLSKNIKILEGFSFNKNVPFDAVVRIPIACVIDRANRSVKLEIPALLPAINLFTPKSNPIYAITVSLSAIPDIKYNNDLGYGVARPYDLLKTWASFTTDWYPIIKGSPNTTVELALPHAMPDNDFSLMVAIGICYGQMEDVTTVKQVKNAGSAKVLAMG